MIVLPASILIYTGWKIWETSLYMILLILTYLILFIFLSDYEGIYKINSEVIKYLSVGNAIAAISILLVILRHLNSSIKEMQKSLEDKNKLLEHKKDELDKKVIERTKTLEKVNDELRQFTYIATHDLKVPVDNILGCYNILLHDIENSSDKTKLIMPWIKKSLDQTSLIISQLIQLEQAGINHMDHESINLEEATQHVINYFSAKVKSLNADIVTDFSECETLYYSKSAFNSIAQNLISNALKYHSPDRTCRITIKAKRKNEFLCFSVEDNGLGIDLKVQRKRLFGLFQRISTTEEGSGFGLHMIKKLLENRGGKIDVESQVGKGSVFYAYIKEII
jgi:signal transduction histidine kinase